jgi:hypothetical protein
MVLRVARKRQVTLDALMALFALQFNMQRGGATGGGGVAA